MTLVLLNPLFVFEKLRVDNFFDGDALSESFLDYPEFKTNF